MKKLILLLVFLSLGGVIATLAQTTIAPSAAPLKTHTPKKEFSKVLSHKILQQNTCSALSTLGGSIRKENYLVSLNESLDRVSNEIDYVEWFVEGKPFPRGDLIRKSTLALSVRGSGDWNKKRLTTARVLNVVGMPQIKSPIKIPLRQTKLENCEDLSTIDSFIKEGVIMAEKESIKLKIYNLKEKTLPPEDLSLLPGEEVFLKNSKICAYEGQAYFSQYDYFDEFDFWQNTRKAFSRQKTKNGTVIKFFDGSSLLVDDREDWFSEIGLAQLESWKNVEENQTMLSATQIKLKEGDSVTLLFSNGYEREVSTEGVFCYEISQTPLDELLEENKTTAKPKEEGKKDKNEFKSGVNNVNTCRPRQYPPNDKSNSARMDQLRVNMCETGAKDISTRQNSIHINQTPQIPNNLANRGQNDDDSCSSPPAPRSKLPRNTPEGRSSVSDRYDGAIEENIYGHDKDISGLADAGGAARYGETSYISALRSTINFKSEAFNRDIIKMQRTRETEALQTKMERAAQSEEEEFKANKLKNCQMKKFRKLMEELAGKPKVKS